MNNSRKKTGGKILKKLDSLKEKTFHKEYIEFL